jgi:hypothetical protein
MYPFLPYIDVTSFEVTASDKPVSSSSDHKGQVYDDKKVMMTQQTIMQKKSQKVARLGILTPLISQTNRNYEHTSMAAAQLVWLVNWNSFKPFTSTSTSSSTESPGVLSNRLAIADMEHTIRSLQSMRTLRAGSPLLLRSFAHGRGLNL